MALGPSANILGGAVRGIMNSWKVIVPGAAAGLTVEGATNTGGKGGWLSQWWRGGTQAGAQEVSATQAIDSLFDSVSASSNGITTLISGGLAQFCEFLNYMGFKPAGEWAEKLRGFEQHTQGVINTRVQASREQGTKTLEEAANDPNSSSYDPEAPAPETSGEGFNMDALAIGAGVTTAATAAAVAPSLIGKASMPHVAAPAATASTASASLWSKIPGRFKMLGLAAGVVGGGWAFLSGRAEAAVDPSAPTPEANPVAAYQDTVTPDVGYAPPEMDGGAMVALGSAGAMVALKTGAKAIPLAGAAIYGGDTLSDTYNYATQGEWGKAGVSLLAGTGLTLGGLGGGVTMGLGEAWHAAIRDGSMAIFGQGAEIEKSEIRQLGEAGLQIGAELLGMNEGELPSNSQAQFMVAANGQIVPQNPMAVYNPNAADAGITDPNANANYRPALAMGQP